jgi:HD domain
MEGVRLLRPRVRGGERGRRQEPLGVSLLIGAVAAGAAAALVVMAPDLADIALQQPGALVSFGLLALGLALVSVEVYGRGSFSFAGCGLLAIGIGLGPGPAALAGIAVCAVTFALRRGKLHRVIFNAGTMSLAAVTAAVVDDVLEPVFDAPVISLIPSIAAAAAFLFVNIGLLTTAMSLSERSNGLAIWRERFRWLTPYYLASGPLAYALVVSYDKMGVAGLAAFAVPPAFMMFSVRQYLARTAASVEDVRQANTDLLDLFRFAAGLAARAHDGSDLRAYAEERLSDLAEGNATLSDERISGGAPLRAGGKPVAWLRIDWPGNVPSERWGRLGDALLPGLATAIESSQLVERLHKTHRDMIAALSRSIEAKDDYTGGHVERVSSIAVHLARRLGYEGEELNAIEIGAIVHDVGKIGVPESILRKPGPLTDDEWKIMREHPVISDFILADVDLHPFVRQIARWSHERLDGAGYPDGLAGDEIPLPARIVLVADAFDALTSDRPYRRGRSAGLAIDELRAHAGTQFCPHVVAQVEAAYREQPELFEQTHAVIADVA